MILIESNVTIAYGNDEDTTVHVEHAARVCVGSVRFVTLFVVFDCREGRGDSHLHLVRQLPHTLGRGLRGQSVESLA